MKNFICLFIIGYYSISGNAQYINFWEPIDPVFDSLVKEIDSSYILYPDVKKQQHIVSEMYYLLEQKENPVMRSRTLQWDAQNQIINSKMNSVDNLLIKAVSLIDTLQYPYDYARIQGLREKILRIQGDYYNAYKISVALLDYYKEIGDQRSYAMTLIQIGVTLTALTDYDKAMPILRKADSILTKYGMEGIAQKNQLNISNILYSQGEREQAVNNLEKLLQNPNAEIIKDTSFIINVQLSLCAFAPDVEQLKKYAPKNYELAKKFKNESLEVKTGIGYAFLLIEEKKYDKAIELLDEINKHARKTKDINHQLYIYRNKRFAYFYKKAWDSAYHYAERFYNLNDSIVEIGKVIEINKIEARRAVQKFEQEKKESEMQRKFILAILFGVCSLSLALISLIYFQNKKTKIQKQLNEAESERLNETLKNKKLREEKLESEINSKNRELTSNTLLLTEKNHVLQDLSKWLKKMVFEGDLPANKAKEIQTKIKSHISTSNEWEYFKLHFESVHPSFFSKLKDSFPALSENNLRLCAYIRIGMEAKQIAQMLSVQPSTIITSRYRLRKKMNITGDESLEDFLREF